MQAHLLQPEKKLRFTEKYFAGYLLQLTTLIRRNESADAVLDGLLLHPMLKVLNSVATAGDAHHGHANAVLQLYVLGNIGDPPGTYPTEDQLKHNPVCDILNF